MSTKAEPYRQPRSSNEDSFENINEVSERGEERSSRPSESSDFDSINDRKIEEIDSESHTKTQRTQIQQKLEVLEKMIVLNEKTIEQQLQIVKLQCKEKQKELETVKEQNSLLNKKCQELQETLVFYRREMEKLGETSQQQSQIFTNMVERVAELKKIEERSSQLSFRKKSFHINSLQDELRENLKQNEVKIHSLNLKLQFFESEQEKVRDFLQKYLKFTPSFTMQLSTLVESAVISLDTYLKELNREIENIILGAHMGNSNKITAKRQKLEQEKYNHWQALNNLEIIKIYVDNAYKR